MSIYKTIFEIDDKLKNSKCNIVNIPNIRIVKDVVYDKSCPELLRADLFFPAEHNGKLRVLVNIHGGGWISGDKKWRVGFSSIMCDGKHFVMNINYGLSPKYKYPFCLANAFAALAYLSEIATEYDLDLDNVYLSGDSAGAQIASVAAAIINSDESLSELNIANTNQKIRGLILFCGAYDVPTLLKMPISLNMLEEVTGYSARDIEQFNYLKYLSTAELIDDNYPPTLIVVAKLDSIVPNQEKKFIAALQSHNVPYHLYISKKLSASAHCFHLYHRLQDSRAALELAKKHLAGELITL